MKRLALNSLGLVAVVFCATSMAAQTSGNTGFEKMKSLTGEWAGKTDSGATAKVSGTNPKW